MSEEKIGLLGNSVYGQTEHFAVVAQFTSMEKAKAYFEASKLAEPETVNSHNNFHEGEHGYNLTFREGSLLRWYNELPEEPDSFYRYGRYVKLSYFEGSIPVDPVLEVTKD